MSWIDAYLSAHRNVEFVVQPSGGEEDEPYQVRQLELHLAASMSLPIPMRYSLLEVLAARFSERRLALLRRLAEDARRAEEEPMSKDLEYPAIRLDSMDNIERLLLAIRRLTRGDLADARSLQEIHDKAVVTLTLSDLNTLLVQAEKIEKVGEDVWDAAVEDFSIRTQGGVYTTRAKPFVLSLSKHERDGSLFDKLRVNG